MIRDVRSVFFFIRDCFFLTLYVSSLNVFKCARMIHFLYFIRTTFWRVHVVGPQVCIFYTHSSDAFSQKTPTWPKHHCTGNKTMCQYKITSSYFSIYINKIKIISSFLVPFRWNKANIHCTAFKRSIYYWL